MRQLEMAVARALCEPLEQRKLLSSQWYAVFGGITPAGSFSQQLHLGQNLLHSAGIGTNEARVIEAMDLSGAFRIEAPDGTELDALSTRLESVPGFVMLSDYVEPAIRKILPKIALVENQFGPFDYDDYLSRIKNGEISDGKGDITPDPFNVLTNNNVGATGTGNFTQSETSVIAFGNNVVIGFNDSGSFTGGSNQFTGWSYSSDGGATFTDGGKLPVSAVGDAGDPVLARNDVTGRIYFSTLGFSGAGTIQMFRSDTNGASWMAPVNATPGGSTEDKQWHTVDNFPGAGQGNVYLLSRRFGAGPGIYFFRSTDHGNTFGPNGGTLIVSGMQGAYISVLPDHSIAAFWYQGTTGQIMMRKSTDFGATFGAPIAVVSGLVGGVNGDLGLTGQRQGTATMASFRSNEFPHVAVNPTNGHMYVTFANNPAGVDKANIYMAMSTDGGATWSAPVQVNDDATTNDQWQPTIAVTPDGSRLGIFYYSRQEDIDASDGDPANNRFKYYGRIGAISGSTVSFLPSFAISDVASLPEMGRDGVVNSVYMSDYDTAFATAGAFHVVWSDNRDNLPGGALNQKDPNVYYKKIQLGLAVAATTPAVGSVLSTQPTNFVVDFTDAIDASTVDASDFTVNGVPADSFTVDDSDTVTFTFNTSPVTSEGEQTMQMAEGAIERDGDANPLIAFEGIFRYDTLTLQVTSTVPPFPGGVFTLPGPFTLEVNFNEPIDETSVSASDLTLSGIPGAFVSGVTVDDADTVTFSIDGVTSEGTLTASIAGSAIQDQFGNNGTNFSANYDVDIGTVAYPVPLAAKKPNGSLVYDPSISGVIGFAGDEDTFFLDIDPNQKITVKVTSAAGLTSEVELRDPSNALLGSSTASGAGANNLIQNVSTTTGGTYLVRVRGAGGSTGGYTVQVVLNAALETESNLGGNNDTLGTAQPLGPTLLNLNSGVSHYSRGAVLGTTDIAGYSGEAVPFEFEDISGTGTLITFTSQDDGATSIPLGFSFPHYGAGFANAFVSTNGLIAFGSGVTTFTNTNLTTTPTQAVIAPFWDDLHLTSGAPGAGVYRQTLGAGPTLRTIVQWNNVRFFTGSTTGDGITFQAVLFADGTVQFNYLDLVTGTAPGNNGASATVGNKNAGAQGPDRLLLAFNDGPNTFVGTGKSSRINLPNPTPDLYAISLTAGQKVTVSATNSNDGTGAGLDLSLLDSGGSTVATGVGGAANLGEVISGYTPPTTGTYYVRMSGASSVPYNVVVTRNAGFDTEANDSFASAQDISGSKGALGAITPVAYQAAPVTPGFEDISGTGTVISGLTGGDDAAASIPIGFSFDFFGAPQTSVFVSTNGLMTFGSGVTTFTNADLTSSPTTATIAPFWDDLHAAGGAADSNIFYEVTGSGADQHLTVQWNKVRFFSGGLAGDTLTFQAQLFADGRIRFNYADLVSGSAVGNNGGSATVGIKNAGTQGPDRVLLAFNNGPNGFVNTGLSTQIAQPAGEDWYSFDVLAGNPINVGTSTPADGPGEFVNDLQATIELYDPSGALVASGTDVGDGRNQSIENYMPAADGQYRIRVAGANETLGEYALGVNFSPLALTFVSSAATPGQTDINETVTVNGSFFDLDTVDAHTALIDWGDGSSSPASVSESGGSGTLSATHQYANGGIYTITLHLTDEHGATDTATALAYITGVGAVGGQIQIIGSDAKSSVQVSREGSRIKVKADLYNGATVFEKTFSTSAVSSIYALMLGGDDSVQIGSDVPVPAYVDGGDGNDQIQSGGGADILLGGPGNDQIQGNGGRDLIIGGLGADNLQGGSGEDLLIAGYTSHDADLAALNAILGEWTSSRSYADRVANIRGVGVGPRNNGDTFLIVDGPDRNAFDDSASDVLSGSSNTDWFFYNFSGGGTSDSTDRSSSESRDDLD